MPMLDDFKRALARIQSDYGFYIDCQANSTVALAGYDLTADERSALTSAEKLADVFREGAAILKLVVTFVGKHDWVNRAVQRDELTLDARVASEVEAIRRADTGKERTDAAIRLMELIG
jgi:hypothetical protein